MHPPERGVDLRFCLDVDADRCVDEADLAADLDVYGPLIRSRDFCEGALTFRAPDQPIVAVKDSLPYLATWLCFRSLPALQANRTVRIPYFSTGSELTLLIDGDDVVMSADILPEFRGAKDAFMLAVFDCGSRFLDFYRRFRAGEPSYQQDILNLENDRSLARAALPAGPPS